ncbi:hypothetical protein AUC71_07855 [Methyloceanibacter marginalis]|uniref:FAD-binding domain-containing protein n=1 Tax=Methyloceanibacter marginalis TaxID=1774971 RepID=A0A1E3WDA4_9HYPH|nr:FAD-dependent monooxygenase [Methyloceanibacter marginalis]ODS03766.1 hypothetical protein AUC71_07855 [Methyloceanibacter marginalis]
MAQDLPVLIAGAGIGGLSTAIALGRAGINATVLERSTFAEESGAGIQLGPNATRILRSLGVLDVLLPQTFRPEAVWLFDGLSGRRLATVPLGDHAEQRYGAPYLTLHRADLHAGLRTAAEAASAVSLSSGFDVSGIEARDGITIANLDGTTIEGSSLIGADGLWSTVRKWVAPEAALSYAGATAFRTLLPRKGLPAPFSAPVIGLWLSPKAHLVHYPVHAGGALNVVAVTAGGRKAQGWNQTADPSSLLSGFTRWCKESKSLLERAEGWRAWSLFSLPALPRWSRGAVTLVGDAAIPCCPISPKARRRHRGRRHAREIFRRRPQRPRHAFRTYENARRPRATRLKNTARRLGRIYHLRGPARLARNTALGLRSETATLRQFDWLYGVD